MQPLRRAASVTGVHENSGISAGQPSGLPAPGSGAPWPAALSYWSELPSESLPVPDVLSGRIPIIDVTPQVEGGRRPAIAAVGESIVIGAIVFREGHDAVNAQVVLVDPAGNRLPPVAMSLVSAGLDRWEAAVRIQTAGAWAFLVEGWSDPITTWKQRAVIKIPAGLDVELELEEGARIFERALAQNRPTNERRKLRSTIKALRDRRRSGSQRLTAATDPEVTEILEARPLRDLVTSCGPWPLRVDRRRALVGAWYEMFPRSEGAKLDPPQSGGNFAAAAKRLPMIAAMGFDVVYLPPIHPIGQIDRKGPNNTLDPAAGDPGSPWAVGSTAGGHDSVHPGLGTLDDFQRFVDQTSKYDLEIALDLALQVAPDHPWVAAGKPWFVVQADGSIATAENPPKKYQDIYPLWFDGDPAGLVAETLRIIDFWVQRGVRIFRVDNPHTKPLRFWDRVLNEARRRDPDIIFLAEAFTRPAMMRALAEIGFHQSYSYFTWRNEKWELEEYFRQLSDESSAYMRPNLFVNTPDILTEYLQYGGPGAFAIRATLAATLAPTWGMYSGFELFEHVAVRPGSEEYLDSEKYQYRPRDWKAAARDQHTLIPYITKLNQVRREHPALQTLRGLTFHDCDNEKIIAYSRSDAADTVIVVCCLDPYGAQEATVHFDMPRLGLDWDSGFTVHDEITGNTWMWGTYTYVRLDPYNTCAHVVSVRKGTV